MFKKESRFYLDYRVINNIRLTDFNTYNTKIWILILINCHKGLGPSDLSKIFGLSRKSMHRHLYILYKRGYIEKVGRPPKTTYKISEKNKDTVEELMGEHSEKLYHYKRFNESSHRITSS